VADDGLKGWERDLLKAEFGGRKAAERRVETLDETLTLEALRKRLDMHERMLRVQFRDRGGFPDEWEAALARSDRQATTMTGALSRYAHVWHLWRIENERLVKAAESPEKRNLVRDMMAREPVRVILPSREVECTGRSYLAMLHLARHYLRLREIDAFIRRLRLYESTLSQTIAESEEKGVRRRANVRLRRAYAAEDRLLLEAMDHRRAIYAHAFTEDGAPADSLADAPDWWVYMTPEDDAALLMGLWKVGPERSQQLREGDIPDPDSQGPPEFGWHSIIASVEKEQSVELAAYYRRDLYQLEAWMRSLPKPPRKYEGPKR
jgi:hypothetical protein